MVSCWKPLQFIHGTGGSLGVAQGWTGWGHRRGGKDAETLVVLTLLPWAPQAEDPEGEGGAHGRGLHV